MAAVQHVPRRRTTSSDAERFVVVPGDDNRDSALGRPARRALRAEPAWRATVGKPVASVGTGNEFGVADAAQREAPQGALVAEERLDE